MKTKFYGKKITGILTLLPETEYNFEDDMKYNNLTEKQNRKLQRTMGYDKHRIFKNDSCVSEIATFGLQHMFDKNLLKKEDISAIILSTSTPDYLIPGTSNMIMEKLNLNNNIFSMDINQQCAGFVNGLFQAFMLLNNDDVKKIVLITGDVLARNPDRSNTSGYPLSGDAICITIIENCDKNLPIYVHTIIDAKGYDALIFPEMGFKVNKKEDLERFSSNKYGNNHNIYSVHMDGQAVFQYVMQDVPKYINETLEFAEMEKEEIDYCFFHQPNKFMVDKLAQKIKIPHEKVPSNVVMHYGNSNSSTIPVCICHNAKKELISSNNTYNCLIAGFGAGLSYSGIIMELENFDFCDILITSH